MIKDKIIRSTGKTAELRFVLVNATEAANKIGRDHGATGYALELLGETVVSSLLLAAGMKTGGVVQLKYEFSGDISLCEADATPLGLVRARIPQAELKKVGNYELMLSQLMMTVRKLDEKGKQLHESVVEMVSTRSGMNLAAYQFQSEQIKSAVGVTARSHDKTDRLDYCVGFLVEAFPKADEATLETVENSIKNLQDFDDYWDASRGFDLERLLHDIAKPYEVQIHREFAVQPFCPCSMDGVKRTLVSLGKVELEDMLKENKSIEIFCDFCRKQYLIPPEGIKELIKNIEGKN